MSGKPFHVLLGPDGAGKSSVLANVRARLSGWRVVSMDEEFLGPEHALIGELRHDLLWHVIPGLGAHYSPEFLVSLLQTAVVHLRDEVIRAGDTPVLVDSYYYKILAKCRLAGVDHSPLYDWWRSFPQPDSVIYLDVSAETAWARSGAGTALNSLEYFGERPEFCGFERYQAGLGKLMVEEVGRVPLSTIGELPDMTRTAAAVLEVLHR